MANEVKWHQRLDSLTAAVRIAIREECRAEQLRMMREGEQAAADALQRCELALLMRFTDTDDAE